MSSAEPGHILAAAGTNGAGKSSIVGPLIEAAGGAYFNPDLYARLLIDKGLPPDEANGRAWRMGYEALQAAIDQNTSFAFETTLGGTSILVELLRALALERRVSIFYVGLITPELHIRRVAERVARGGHDIPEVKIRERFDSSRANLLKLIGTRAGIRVWDNSTQTSDGEPAPREIFRVSDRKIVIPQPFEPQEVVQWAQPLLARAMGLRRVLQWPSTA